MSEITRFLVSHGGAVLFLFVFLEQAGLPLTVDELHRKQEAGENPIVLDLRAPAELEQDPALIRGALHMTMEEVERRQHEIPRDRDIILDCSCPNEAGSARVALLLHRQAIRRVRPLLGGIEAWRRRNYPTETCGARKPILQSFS